MYFSVDLIYSYPEDKCVLVSFRRSYQIVDGMNQQKFAVGGAALFFVFLTPPVRGHFLRC